MKKHKLNIVLSMILAGLSAVALSGCSEWDKKSPDENTTVAEVAQDSNAILEPIGVAGRGYDYIELRSSGIDEDGIDHVAFYAIANGVVKSSTSKRLEGNVSFDIQVRLTGLKDDTVYELRTVCYSVNGKTKSIEKHSVKTFAKTPNDPSNDQPIAAPIKEPTVEPSPEPSVAPSPEPIPEPSVVPSPVPSPEPTDTQKPVITLNGASTLTLTVGDTYTEQGATVTDNVDTGLIATIGGDTVDTSTAGTYVVTYSATDSAGNVADVVRRTVSVVVTPNHTPVLNSVSVSWNTVIGKWNNNYIIAQNSEIGVTFSANWSDEDWDTLRIVINWITYSWNSKTLNLNLAKWEIKKFYIQEFDWKKYSNQILVQVAWG